MMTEIGFEEISKALENVKLPDCELVVGIANGGVVPASLIALKVGCGLRIVQFKYRSKDNTPQSLEPVLVSTISLPANIRRILLVDDVTVSGKTLEAAKKLFKEYEVATMVFWGKADYVLFPEITTCVKWPWQI